jgi:hypothetical protein
VNKWSDFEIGDLVEYEGTNINPDNFIVGVVLGYKEFTEWDVHTDGSVKIKSVVVHWNNGLETNTSPLVLRKL